MERRQGSAILDLSLPLWPLVPLGMVQGGPLGQTGR
jgi:hypothetical protein